MSQGEDAMFSGRGGRWYNGKKKKERNSERRKKKERKRWTFSASSIYASRSMAKINSKKDAGNDEDHKSKKPKNPEYRGGPWYQPLIPLWLMKRSKGIVK